MGQQSGRKSKKTTSATGRESLVGVWTDLVLDNERVFNDLLRADFNDALNGDAKAIRELGRALEANRTEWVRQEGERARQSSDAERGAKPTGGNADLAMLILGIGVIDNSTLRKSGVMDEPDSEDIAQQLRPTHLASWVRDFAGSRSDASRSRAEREPNSAFLAEADRDVDDWKDVKDRVIAARLRRSGPEGRRFRKGQSGNKRGRPRKRCSIAGPSRGLPYGDFLQEPATLPAPGGKTVQGTKLDALMMVLVSKAGKGDRKLRHLLMPLLMDRHEERWNEPPDSAEIIRG